MNVHLRLFTGLLLAVLAGGCGSVQTAFREGMGQSVRVDSFPGDAAVFINDTYVGQTPVQMELGRKIPHKVVLRKEGYQTAVTYFVPEPNERATHFIKYGLLEDLGYYKTLTPEALAQILDHHLVPVARAARPFDDMTRRILQADSLLDAGQLSALEHKVITDRIIQFYVHGQS